MEEIFKSIIDQDRASVVVCNPAHDIIYMNPASIRRYKGNLVGKSIFDCHNGKSCEMIKKIVDWFAEDKSNNMIHTFYNVKESKDVYMVALRNSEGELIGYYEKHEYRTKEDAPLYDFSKSLI